MQNLPPYKGFEDLDCWKQARALRIRISETSKRFPAEEKFGLTSQVIRSSRSVTNSIAEKAMADSAIQTHGSLTETMDHLSIAFDEKYIKEDLLKKLELMCENVFKWINGYIGYLDKQKQNPNSKLPITNF